MNSNRPSDWWENYGGYIKLGSALAAVIAAGVGVPQIMNTDSESAYDLRVREANKDIEELKAEAKAAAERSLANTEAIAKMRAEITAFHNLAEERERRFLRVEAENQRQAERLEIILDRIRALENRR